MVRHTKTVSKCDFNLILETYTRSAGKYTCICTNENGIPWFWNVPRIIDISAVIWLEICWVNESILCGLGQKYFEMLQISNKSKKSTTNRIYYWWFFRFPDCAMFSDRCISLFVHFIFINVFIFIDKTQTMHKEINKSGNIVQKWECLYKDFLKILGLYVWSVWVYK